MKCTGHPRMSPSVYTRIFNNTIIDTYVLISLILYVYIFTLLIFDYLHPRFVFNIIYIGFEWRAIFAAMAAICSLCARSANRLSGFWAYRFIKLRAISLLFVSSDRQSPLCASISLRTNASREFCVHQPTSVYQQGILVLNYIGMYVLRNHSVKMQSCGRHLMQSEVMCFETKPPSTRIMAFSTTVLERSHLN